MTKLRKRTAKGNLRPKVVRRKTASTGAARIARCLSALSLLLKVGSLLEQLVRETVAWF